MPSARLLSLVYHQLRKQQWTQFLWAYRLTTITAEELSHHHPTKICCWVIADLLAASILAGEVSSRASSGAFMCCAGKALSQKKKSVWGGTQHFHCIGGGIISIECRHRRGYFCSFWKLILSLSSASIQGLFVWSAYLRGCCYWISCAEAERI